MSPNYREQRAGNLIVGWNAEVLAGAPDADFFDPDHWRSQQAIIGKAEGRGRAYFIDAGEGRHWVLRHNRRGGLLARINHDRYLWTGADRVRPLQELRLLAHMRSLGLPVPCPVAALGRRHGLSYRGDIVMQEIKHAQTLADVLAAQALVDTAWQRLGGTIADFHRAGIWHGDLNARNILIDGSGAFHLIDFDKAGQRAAGPWQQVILARLRRSLDKFLSADTGFHFSDDDWHQLNTGYERALSGSL